MKTLFSISFVSLLLLNIGCERESSLTRKGEKFNPGYVWLGITNDAALETIFDTLNTLNLAIELMCDFDFVADYPADSVNALIELFNQKPYIDTFYFDSHWQATTSNIYYYPPEQKIRIECCQLNMNPENQADFLILIQALNLTKVAVNPSMLLKVPIGTEKYWVNELKRYSFTSRAGLSEIFDIGP